MLRTALTFAFATVMICTVNAQQPPPDDTNVRRPRSKPRNLSQFRFTDRQANRASFGHLAESPSLHVDNDIHSLLQYKPVQNELNLNDEQLRKIATANVDRIRFRQEALRSLPQATDPRRQGADAERVRQALDESSRKTEAAYDQILTAAQRTRLRQISLELRIQSAGIVAVLRDPQMVAELQISDQQLEQILKKAIESSKEFDRQIIELKRRMREEITTTLTDDQLMRLKGMLGKPFDWEEAKAK